MNRRAFLKSLFAIGTSIVLPIDLATAKSTNIPIRFKGEA